MPFKSYLRIGSKIELKAILTSLLLCTTIACTNKSLKGVTDQDRIRVIIDTDANNEIDDQFALAYLLFNGELFDLEGVTVNATRGGGHVDLHYEEARRILMLSNR